VQQQHQQQRDHVRVSRGLKLDDDDDEGKKKDQGEEATAETKAGAGGPSAAAAAGRPAAVVRESTDDVLAVSIAVPQLTLTRE